MVMAATADKTLQSILGSLGRNTNVDEMSFKPKPVLSKSMLTERIAVKVDNSSIKEELSSVSMDFKHGTAYVHNNDPILLAPYNYLIGHPGKSIRSKMIQAFDHWLQVPAKSLAVITRVVEMLHNASLLVDDIEDDSTLRRGAPVAHHIYGMAQTINCANYAYFLALQELQKLSNDQMMTIFSEEILNLHRGQGIELFWRDSITCPTEEEFIDMINNKTGGLLRLAVRLMMAASKVEMDYTRLVNLIGIHFQIRDDYMNLQSKHYTDSKGFCEDLSEGKFSFPVIHSIRASPNDRQLLEILKQKPQSVELKQYALKLMEATHTFDYTKQYLRDLFIDIQEEVGKFGNNPVLDKILVQLDVHD
ncbi:unnamed protein product [Umbelopsis ramanniana]